MNSYSSWTIHELFMHSSLYNIHENGAEKQLRQFLRIVHERRSRIFRDPSCQMYQTVQDRFMLIKDQIMYGTKIMKKIMKWLWSKNETIL